MVIYCGNNRIYAEENKLDIGTRYQCLKKGIGIGLNTPVPADYESRYEPIDDIKIYCGNSDALPAGYDRFGVRGECFRKGFGRGRHTRYEREHGGEVPARAPRGRRRDAEIAAAPVRFGARDVIKYILMSLLIVAVILIFFLKISLIAKFILAILGIVIIFLIFKHL